MSPEWEGARPAYMPEPLPPAVEAEQLRLLGEARNLVERSRSDFAQMQPSEVVSIETRAHPQSRCVVGVDIGFVETYTAAVCFRLEDVDLGTLPLLALLHDPDLIKLPRFPGLPYIEHITLPHKFAPSDWIYRICMTAWGPFPGIEDYHNVVLFDLLDAPSTNEGQFMFYAQSPPEAAQSHRGWAVPPLGPRRKRNILHGATFHVWAASDALPGAAAAPAAAAAPPAAAAAAPPAAAAPGAAPPVRRQKSMGVAERIGARRRAPLAERSAPPIALGLLNVDVYMKLKLPIPRWLIPNTLIRWVTPRFIRAVFPTLVNMCFDFEASQFAQRVRADSDGFFAHCATRVVPETAQPAQPCLNV